MEKKIQYLDDVTIRFAGDSGDGMQLTGAQFADNSASTGNIVNTFPDYPSEIRAPEGTLYGVSAYQIHFGNTSVNTPGDEIDVLVAFNAASLKVNLQHLKKNGLIIANTPGFVEKYLKLAKYDTNPLTDGSLNEFKLLAIDFNQTVDSELKGSGLSPKHISRTKNIFTLGMTYWLFDKPLEPTKKWLTRKFSKKQSILDANLKIIHAGFEYAKNNDFFDTQFKIKSASMPKGTYRIITGNEAVALAMVVAANKSKLPLFLGSYPITPATEILHHISGYKKFGVKHLQAEDEIAGICSAIGAAYGGSLALTTTSGPGLSLKVEAIGLAVILEIPLVIVDVQRAGPSTGMPTKTEQGDLMMSIFGRHGEAPLPVIAASTASDCFAKAFEAARIAIKYMTPVILLTDGYLGQSSEPWRIPELDELPDISPTFYTDTDYQPYKRDPETLARLWALPGTPGLEHRIGGLEKEDISGLVSQDPLNHEKMVYLRDKKIKNIANEYAPTVVDADNSDELLVVGWGSTYGAIRTAIDTVRSQGKKVSYVHLANLNPLPNDLGDILKKYKKILLPENNIGQLKYILEANYLLPVIGLNKIQGNTFRTYEIENKILAILNGEEA